jgi:biotin carboxylase
MPEKPEAVLVIGVREPENEPELVRALGYQVLYCNATIALDDALRVDVPVELDLNNEDAVLAHALALARRYTVRAVYTLGEYRVPLACRLAAALEIPHGLPVEAALNCRHKQRTKRLLAQHGVGTARFALVRTPHEALAALRDLPLPVVVKPSNDAGSCLVHRCATSEAVQDVVAAIRCKGRNTVGQVLDPEILVEEYLDGPEYSVEACTARGCTTMLAITTKQITPWPYTVERGHMVPAPLAEAETQALYDIVTRALAVLGVDQAVTHTEVKLLPGGARIVEVNARPAGHPIPTLVRAVTGYDLREVALHMALGHGLEAVPRHAMLAPSAASRDLIAEQDGILAMHEEVLSETPAVQLIDLTVHTGARVGQTTSNYNQLGRFVVYGTDARDADAIADDVLRRLHLRVVPCVSQSVGGQR